jgi:hypothetical protein
MSADRLDIDDARKAWQPMREFMAHLPENNPTDEAHKTFDKLREQVTKIIENGAPISKPPAYSGH